MTNEHARSLIAQLVIAAAVCGGMHAIVASPLRARAILAEAELHKVMEAHNLTASTLADLPAVVEQQAGTLAAAAEFAARNAPALDESEMFAQVMDLAVDAGVGLQQIVPAGAGSSATESKAPRTVLPGDRRVRYSLVGTGTYDSTTGFLRRLQDDWGFCAIRQVRVTPDFQSGVSGGVQFSILVELFSFDPRPLVLAPTDAGGAP
jgi:hypothetical protein